MDCRHWLRTGWAMTNRSRFWTSQEFQSVVARLIGAILKIIFDALLGAAKRGGGVARPLLIVMEEAHHILSKDADGRARTMMRRVVKEERKFGIGAMIVISGPPRLTKQYCPSVVFHRIASFEFLRSQ